MLEAPFPTDEAVLLATRTWLERAVIGLGLCPFAKGVHAKDQIRYAVSAAETKTALLADLRRELQALSDADAEQIDTALLIAPRVLGNFLEYNDFLRLANAELEALDLSGTLQIASFHPDYEFSDGEASDAAHLVGRSPYPMLHLLREDSVARAVEAFPDAARIFEKNIATLRALGHDGWRRVLAGSDVASRAPSALPQAGGFAELLPGSPALGVLAELGFDTPTKIQEGSLPALLAGSDLVGQSQTGSGKTAAFCLPLLERVNLGERALQGLVLCPTRELSAQVARELRKLGRGRAGLSVVVLSGGEAVRDQTRTLEKGVHLAVGTPGRVIDHLQRRTLRVHRVGAIVLDEADRMLDMGFQADIEKILKALPSPRQTVFFSATFPPSIRELSAKYQQNPRWVTVSEGAQKPPDIRELVVSSGEHEKLGALRAALARHPHEAALVFANQKLTVKELEETLRASGSSVAALHGDLEQRDRDRVLAKFRNGSVRLLVATDVAARGIDLDSLDLVINFDLPSQPEIYVHRIGRTGRAGKTGLAVSLRTPRDQPKVEAIEAYTGRPLELVTYSPEGATASTAATPSATAPLDAKMDTLRLSGGRKDKLRPGDILGALTGEAGALRGDQIGKIEIHERFSFVALARGVSEKALASLRAGRIKGRRFRVERVE
jgi:ATP-independent RNA helicase DbpA